MNPAIYRHHNGGRFRLLHVATDLTKGDKVGVFMALGTGELHTQPLNRPSEESITDAVTWRDGATRARFMEETETTATELDRIFR